MIKLGAMGLLFVALASQAAALSCAPPDIKQTFNYLHKSPKTYVMGLGKITAQNPIPEYIRGEARQIPAKFEGVFLGKSGKTKPQTVRLTVEATCVSVWCGNFPKTDKQMLVFLQKTATGYQMESGPCGGHFKISPTSRDIRVLKRCLKNKGC